MNIKTLASLFTLGLVGVFVSAGIANADTVSATLAAQYFQVASGSDPDFNTNSTPNVLDGSSLGPNGLPVASSPYGVNDVNPTTHEITWWSPSLNSNVAATGTGTISLPFGSDMYAPNSTGTNDFSYFETAIFTGVFNLATAGTVTFQLGSDDDSFIYVDGTLFGQNPGVHAVTSVNFTSPTLGAGNHTLEVFYADRQVTGAYLSLSLESTGITIVPPTQPTGVPEPSSLMLFGTGFIMLSFAYRRKHNSV